MIGDLTRFQRDTLKEVCSIGTNSASTALSKMTNKFILVQMKSLRAISVDDAPSLFGSFETKIVGTLLTFKGDMAGTMLCLSTENTALSLGDLVQGKKVGETKKIDVQSKDVIKEIGNILVGCYLAALTDISKLNMIESQPELIVDTMPNILEKALGTFEGDIKNVIVIETCLLIEKQKFVEEIIIMLKPTELDRLFNVLFKELK